VIQLKVFFDPLLERPLNEEIFLCPNFFRGVEPGSIAWKAIILTVELQTRCRSIFKWFIFVRGLSENKEQSEHPVTYYFCTVISLALHDVACKSTCVNVVRTIITETSRAGHTNTLLFATVRIDVVTRRRDRYIVALVDHNFALKHDA
jgi:hypothetical protein